MLAQALKAMDDEEVAELFGDVVQEIADRTGSGDRVMYELARRFWDEVQEPTS